MFVIVLNVLNLVTLSACPCELQVATGLAEQPSADTAVLPSRTLWSEGTRQPGPAQTGRAPSPCGSLRQDFGWACCSYSWVTEEVMAWESLVSH